MACPSCLGALAIGSVRWRWPLAALFLLGSVLWLFAEVVFQGKVLFFGDVSLYFLPQLAFERRELLEGRLPLWNPYLFCGQPFVGNPQTWPLYPSALALLLWEAERANALSTAFHVLWLALGMLLFLRHRGLGAAAATLGAVAFSCGGAVVSKAQFPNMLQAESWLPWLLLTVDRLMERRTPERVVGVALCSGLAVLAAHAQITMMQFYVVLAWCLFRLPRRSQGWQRLGGIALAGALGACLAMGQLLPVVEHVRASVRPELSLEHANRFYLPFQELILLILPNALGNPATRQPWQGPGNFWEPCSYLGLATIGLVVAALLRPRQLSSEARFWMLVSLVGLWLALGRYGGLYSLAFRVLPGVKQFHDPARFLYVATFALACLAANQAQILLRGRRIWQLVVLAVTALDVITFSRTLNPSTTPEALAQGRVLLAARLQGVERVFHSEPYRPWQRWVSYRSYKEVSTEEQVAAFVGSATPNLPFWVGVRQAGGYEPVVRRDVDQVLRQLGPLPQAPDQLAPWQAGFLEQLGVGLVIGYDTKAQSVTQRRLDSPEPLWTPSVIRETQAPGWSTQPSGKIFRRAPALGQEIRYDPTVWRVGVFLSLGSACILGALLTYRVRSRAWQT